jgi:rhodanese-related sulfurtransferase
MQMNHPTSIRNCSVASILVAVAMLFAGCGTNTFQQELKTEEAAVKLAGETIRGKYELISTPELKKLVDSEADFVLVDAMPAANFEKGHIQGAVNIEFPKEAMDAEGVAGEMSVEDGAAKLLGDDTSRLVVVYCGFVKCARSHNAALWAHKLGFTNVKRHPGGIHAWRGAGYDLVTD